MGYVFKMDGDSQRAGDRIALAPRTMFVVGKLTRGNRDYVCRVRNISQGGVGIQHDADLAVDDPVTIEMRGLPSSRAVVRWIEGDMAGLEFLDAVELEFLHGDVHQSDGRTLRSPRFAVAQHATLQTEIESIAVRVVDLALGGMKIEADCAHLDGTAATVLLDGHDKPLKVRVCWATDMTAGLRFAAPLTTRDLVALLAAGDDDA